MPFTSLTAIAIRRTTTNQKDLFSGKIDVGYEVVVADDQNRTAAFFHRGYGLDELVEPLLDVMVAHVASRLEAAHAAGQAIVWAPGVTLDQSLLRIASKQHDVRLDDAEVRLQVVNGTAELCRRDEQLTTLRIDGPNFEPVRKLLGRLSAWRVG